jgi:hypothetical protein
MGSPPLPAGDAVPRHEKIAAFVSRSGAAAEPRSVSPAGTDQLDAFGSEEAQAASAAAPGKTLPARTTWIALAVVAAAGILLAAVFVAPGLIRLSQGSTTRPGRVTIATTPIGVEVSVDGQPRGLTPLSLELDPGTHSIKLLRGTDERTISIQVASGADMTQHYEFASQPAPTLLTSTLTVMTDPPGARVSIDGEARGTSPVTVPGLSASRHRVVVTGENGSLERQVTTEPGGTSSVVFSLPRTPAVSAGWLAVAAPFDVQILEKGEVIGTSASPRFMVAAGAHELELVNKDLGFREQRRIDISSGATATVKIDARASVSANARPWADVTVDGRAVGQTPIANLSLSLGSHLFVFRHPDLGERQQNVVVTAHGPNRIAVDLTK